MDPRPPPPGGSVGVRGGQWRHPVPSETRSDGHARVCETGVSGMPVQGVGVTSATATAPGDEAAISPRGGGSACVLGRVVAPGTARHLACGKGASDQRPCDHTQRQSHVWRWSYGLWQAGRGTPERDMAGLEVVLSLFRVTCDSAATACGTAREDSGRVRGSCLCCCCVRLPCNGSRVGGTCDASGVQLLFLWVP